MWLIADWEIQEKNNQNTRHNVGFDLVDSIIKKNNFKLHKKTKQKKLIRVQSKKLTAFFANLRHI